MDTSTALHLISLLDLTSLNATDTPDEIQVLCERAADPFFSFLEAQKSASEVESAKQLAALSTQTVAAVCVYPVLVEAARKCLDRLECYSVQIASVAGGFPSGMTPISTRLLEIKYAVQAGASEIDTVLNRSLFRQGLHDEVIDEITRMKEACGNAHLKVILETGELRSEDEIYAASRLSIQAGADFIKTSTGKVTPAATPEAFRVMLRAIADEYRENGKVIGCKPAGGIRTADDALTYMDIAKKQLSEQVSEEFAIAYLHPETFRIGASSLLDDLLQVISKNLSNS